jgi:peptidoglycan hydrolase-like protein with peptidoglycan-binding domain
VVTASVERRVVGEDVVTRGMVAATATLEVVPAGVPEGVSRAVISGPVPALGKSVGAGEVVIEISGRPVMALTGSVLAYRDLMAGDSGPDVAQLQKALAGAGFKVGDPGGVYGEATAKAVSGLYEKAGYAPPASGGLPAREVVYASALPAQVVKAEAVTGGDAEGASIQLASGELVVTAEFPSGKRALVRPGGKATVSSEILGESVEATIGQDGAGEPAAATGNQSEAASPAPGQGEGEDSTAPAAEAGTNGETVVIRPDAALPAVWADQDVRVRVISAESEGEVMAVPVTAVFGDGSGQRDVIVLDSAPGSDGPATRRRVPVEVGVVGGGWAEVRAAGGETLEVGATVLLSTPTGVE